MNKLSIIIVSLILGASSWAICPLVSKRFEPFDTGLGFFIGQFVMVLFTVYIGWKTNTINVIISVLGLYFSQNAYAYIFGTSEAIVWAVLLLVTSLVLCILPLIGGLAARGVNVFLQRQTKSS
jgi:hypothetical protein